MLAARPLTCRGSLKSTSRDASGYGFSTTGPRAHGRARGADVVRLRIFHLLAASGILFNALYFTARSVRRSFTVYDRDAVMDDFVDDAGGILWLFAVGSTENET